MPDGNITRRVFLGQTLVSVLALPARAEATSPQDGFRVLEARAGNLQLLPEPAVPAAIWGFDGAVPGPLLRFKKGEEVKVRLVNKLPRPMSLTWHGVRIANPMDGVGGLTQEPVAPGRSFDYRFTPPDSGLSWYHPHVGSIGERQARGLYGAMIVDEPQPPVNDRDMVVILDVWDLDGNGQIQQFDKLAAAARADGAHPDSRADMAPPAVLAAPGRDPGAGTAASVAEGKPLVTVNGRTVAAAQLLPPSSRLRLRIVNAGARHMAIDLAGVTPFVLAIDGQPCEAFTPAKNIIPLGPGARFDVMADLPSDPGAGASLRLLGDNEPGRDLLTFTAAGNQRTLLPPIASLPQNPLLPAQIRLETAHKFNISIEAITGAGPQPALTPQAQPAILTLNGKVYNGFAPPPLFSVRRKTPVTLGFTNRTKTIQAIHVHGHAMRLLYDLDDGWEPYWRDTLVIAEGKTKHAAFVADNPGKWAIDCLAAGGQGAVMASWFEVI